MKQSFKTVLLLIILVTLFSCNKDDEVVVTNTEEWTAVVDQGAGEGFWELITYSDLTIKTNGYFTLSYEVDKEKIEVHCPFTVGIAEKNCTKIIYNASGTAFMTADSTNTSLFTIDTDGVYENSEGTGSYKITFANSSWPSQVLGTWRADQTGGHSGG